MDRHFLLLLCGMLAMNAFAGHSETVAVKHHAYIAYMGERPEHSSSFHPDHVRLLQRAVGISEVEASARLVYSYTKSLNGFTAMLSAEEAEQLSGAEEVVSVFPSRERELHTTRSWNFMGFPTSAPRGAFESDVIIGMIDTGIWPELESFDDTGFGPPPSKWKGVCQSNNNFTCNNKIVGARYYHLNGPIGQGEIASPRDTEGHGTHTASTAAGRVVANASLSGIADGKARGAVPSARIAVYKVCWGGCSDANMLAAFDDAIADGVDIISISIGGGGSNYFQDTISIGSFHAMKRNILTSSSAGNSGPGRSTVGNFAPWLLTVAASTIDRKIVARALLGDGQKYEAMVINTHGLNDVMHPLIYGGDAANVSAGFDPSFSRVCGYGSLDSILVKGKVVLCDLNTDASGVKYAGGIGAILKADDLMNVSFSYALPVVVLESKDAKLVYNYVKNISNPTATISKSEGVFDSSAPYVASFSSRGPNPVTPNILKPDLTAPGVDILAAWPPTNPENPGVPFNIISGTSMSCPHASGTAAYVKSFHPTWSVAAIKSALMTTTYLMSPNKNPDAEFAYGTGHINPLAAVNPGLIYDASEKDYVSMLCAQGYSTKNLRLLTGDNSSCTPATNGTVLDLNYPSFALLVKQGESFSSSFHRVVTNVGKANSSYKVTVNAPPGLTISVTPNILTFKALSETKSFVIKVEGDATKAILSASLTWSDGIHNVRSPITVYT